MAIIQKNAANLRLSKGQFIQTVGVSLLGLHHRVSFLGQQLTEGSDELQVRCGRHIVVPSQLRLESEI